MEVFALGQYAVAYYCPGLRIAALTMLAVLGSFGTALFDRTRRRLHVDIVILAVVLAMTLSRTDRPGREP